MIFLKSQITELKKVSRKDRRKIFRHNHFNTYNHLLGWTAYFFMILAIVTGVFGKYFLPRGNTFWHDLVIFLIPFSVLVIIHRICYLTVIAPYVRKDIETLNNENTHSNGRNASEPFT